MHKATKLVVYVYNVTKLQSFDCIMSQSFDCIMSLIFDCIMSEF